MSPLRWWRRRDELPVAELQKSNPVRLGIVVLVVTLIVVYFGFTKHIPFTHGFRLKAQFATAVNIRPKSPVRIAGVPVGKVESVQREGNTGLVTMDIENDGLPIHADATLKIRPRIFLEGNFFVELQPGSPSARTLSSGATIPITQTSDPVQIDQVLTALNTDTRANLQTFLAEYGDALTRKPTPSEDAEQDPDVRGLNAAQALNKAYQRGPEALRDSAIVSQALGGSEQHDISHLIAGVERTTSALNAHEQQLGELIGNFDTFLGSIAAQASSVSAAVALLPSALRSTTTAFTSLDAALPATRTFAQDIIPGVQQTPATIEAALPWIAQTRALLAPAELGGLAQGLRSASPALAQLLAPQPEFFNQTALLSKCLTNVFFPASEAKLQDGANTSGVSAQQEFLSGLLLAFNSAGQSFDGNGAFQRLLVTGGAQTITTPPAPLLGSSAKSLPMAASTALSPLGTSPRLPSVEPPYKPLVACNTQKLPDFNGPAAQGPADGTGG
ncbi:MAG TPA: MlaD family protein [Solirubrobacteraceae bacterium]|jgi:ABC-type transporter Mla subunit MlaD